MRIAYISTDWSVTMQDDDGKNLPGGSGWWRCAIPARYLAEHGHKTTMQPQLAVARGSGEIMPVDQDGQIDWSGYDVIVTQRWMSADAEGVYRRARSCGQVVIADMDDHFDGLDPSNAAFTQSHPKVNAEVNRDHYRRSLGACSALTVSTPYLASRLERLGVPVLVVPNAIDLDRWTVRSPSNGEDTVVGWVGATPWRSGDLETLRGVLGPFLRRHGFLFAHHGYHPQGAMAADLLGLTPDQVMRIRAMVSITDYPGLFDGIDIGLVPLRDTPFNQSKSVVKGLELSASGIPFVAQATGEYARDFPDQAAKRSKDWIRKLERLANPSEREMQAKAVRALAETHDAAVLWPNWERAYASVS